MKLCPRDSVHYILAAFSLCTVRLISYKGCANRQRRSKSHRQFIKFTAVAVSTPKGANVQWKLRYRRFDDAYTCHVLIKQSRTKRRRSSNWPRLRTHTLPRCTQVQTQCFVRRYGPEQKQTPSVRLLNNLIFINYNKNIYMFCTLFTQLML